jgi:hypothetical protein
VESLLEVIEDGRRTADEQPVSAIRQAMAVFVLISTS